MKEKNPEKSLKIAWDKLLKRVVISNLIPAVLFRYGYVAGWNDSKKVKRL